MDGSLAWFPIAGWVGNANGGWLRFALPGLKIETWGTHGGGEYAPRDLGHPPADSAVGSASAGMGLGIEAAGLYLGDQAKALPGIGNGVSALTGVWDGYQAVQDYNYCMTHY